MLFQVIQAELTGFERDLDFLRFFKIEDYFVFGK